MEIDYDNNDKYFDSRSVQFDIVKSINVESHFYVRRDNGNTSGTDFVDVERLSFRLSKGLLKTIEDFDRSKFRRLVIEMKLE